MERVVVIDSYRTPIGRTAGGLSQISDVELMAYIFRETCNRSQINIKLIDDIIVGCCFQSVSGNLAKKSAILAGLDSRIAAMTVNRTCASSMEALTIGANDLMLGNGCLKLIGGTENMNQNPNVIKKNMKHIREVLKYGMKKSPDTITDKDVYDDIGSAIEYMAKKNKINRELQDIYSLNSHEKAKVAWRNGFYNDEVIEVNLPDNNIHICIDETIDFSADLDTFRMAQPLYYADGVITKKNVSSINDGAATMLLTTYEIAKKYNIAPLAEYITSVTCGGHPKDIGIVAAMAIKNLLDKSGLELNDIDLIECNEAYAAQMIVCKRILGWDDEIVNISGGSIALGHPLGCTGLRICTTLLHNMKRLRAKYGIAAMCAGGGMGKAILFKGLDIE